MIFGVDILFLRQINVVLGDRLVTSVNRITVIIITDYVINVIANTLITIIIRIIVIFIITVNIVIIFNITVTIIILIIVIVTRGLLLSVEPVLLRKSVKHSGAPL